MANGRDKGVMGVEYLPTFYLDILYQEVVFRP